MIVILLRIVACMAIITLPFLLLALASGTRDGRLWMMFPILTAGPALLLALVFAPVEAFADARGLPKTQAVFIAAAAAATLFWLARQIVSASAQGKPILSIFTGDYSLRGLWLWIGLAVLFGAIWRGSESLAKWFGWIGNG